MKPFIAPDLIPAFPEIVMAVLAMILLLLGTIRKNEDFKLMSNTALLIVFATAACVTKYFTDRVFTFNGMYVTDSFTSYMKLLVLMGSGFSIFMSQQYAATQRISRFEYPVLVLFSTIGMMLMVSANSLLSLYMALELQSLPLYVLASIQRDNLKSTEAGLKYFVLGALSSGMLLYGSSLIYGYTGSADFVKISQVLSGLEVIPVGVIIGMVLLLSGLAFKTAAVPFHMWTPDVYEGAPTSVTAFFALAPKVAAVALLTRVVMGPFGGLGDEWRQIIIALSIASMVLGSVAAIGQTNIKRLLAYSSIGHVGYLLMGLAAAAGTGAAATDSIKSVLIYLTIYVISSIGVFAIVLMMKQKDRMLENISDLAGLASRQPLVAFAMAALMFSMAGIPPLAGFFAKLFVFQSAMAAHLYTLAVIGVVSSVIAAYYYIRIIKVMYFDAPAEEPMDVSDNGRLNLSLIFSTVVILGFAAFPLPLVAGAAKAAAALLK